MRTSHRIKRPFVLGITLTLFTVPLLLAFISVHETPEKSPAGKPEFTDIRIMRLASSISQSESEFVRRVIIHSGSSYPSIWCQFDDANAIACPPALGDESEEHPHEQPMNHFGIPLL